MRDLLAVRTRDPACHRLIQPLLFFKGYQAVQAHRLAHWLWRQGRRDMAYFVQMRTSEVFGVDIHPNATLGKGIMIDHGTGVVIGATCIIGNDVKLYQGVTLGALSLSARETQTLRGHKRHPTIEDEVVIYANATILGGETVIGRGAVIGGNCWVTRSVPPGARVAVT